MVSIKLWNFLRGYVIIKVEGLAIEKFLNLVMVNEVYIWDVERKNYTTLTAKVSTKAFKEVLQYAKKTGCSVFIVSKKGLPFVIFRLRKRKGIVLGFLLSVLLVYLFSTFIWEIDVKTVNGLKEEEVAKKLSEMGLKSGVSKFKIDINKLEKEFLLNNEEVAWIGINVRGTKAFVKVVGKTKPQKVLSKEEPCNIIAKRDGIIYKMTVLEGEAVKKVGDTVKTGDILISGIIEKPGLDTMFVHADGEVLARTWYEISVEEELKRTRWVKTGEKIVATKIIIGSNTITFTPRKIEFEKFEKEEKNLIPYEAPFKIVKEVYYEVKPEVETVPIKEAKEKGRKKALEELEKVVSPGGKVVNKKEKYEVIDGRILRVTVMAEVLEDIGVKEKISYTGGEGKRLIKELAINIDNVEETANLFGNFDENIKLIEKGLDVKIVVRGGTIKITGEEKNVDSANKLFTKLMDMIKRGDVITTQNVLYTMNLIDEGEEEKLKELMSDIVCITARGKQIRCKTYGQLRYVEAIRKNQIVFGIGPAGTGKTYLAMAMAITALKNKEVGRIILTRPAVEAGEKLGFLLGDLQEKVDPYLRPLYDALYDILGAEVFQKYMEKGLIEVAPLAYMRGRTLDDSFIILDEAQNTTPEQMKMFLTRIGFGSKAVITGDVTQIDLPKGKKSGLKEVMEILRGIEGIEFVMLSEQDVIRHPLVAKIIKAYEEYEKRKEESDLEKERGE